MTAANALSDWEDLLRQAEELKGNNPERSKELCEQVLAAISDGSAPASLRVRALYCYANAFAHLNRSLDAVSVLKQTLECAKQSGDAPYQRRAMSELGYFMAEAGETQEAIEMLEAANSVMETPHAATLSMLGHLRGAAGDVQQGELSYKRSLEAQEVGLDFEMLASEVAPDMDPVRRRRIRSTMFVLINYGADLCGCATSLPGVWPVVDTVRARELLHAGLRIARALQDSNAIEVVLSFLGHASEAAGDTESALQYYREGVATLESRWRSIKEDAYRVSLRDFFSLVLKATAGLQRVYLSNRNNMLALQVADQSRSRSLLALMLKSCDAPPILDLSGDRLSNPTFLQGSTMVYYSILTDCSLAAWVIAADGELRGCKTLDLSSVVSHTEQGISGYVEAFRGELSVVARGESVCAAGSDAEDLVHADDSVGNQSQDRTNPVRRKLSLKHAKNHLGSCYTSLWAPLTEWIRPGERITIVPDRDLYMLPFAALWDAESRQYLIERHELSIMPSILVGSALEQLTARSDVRRAALVMGVSNFSSNVDNGDLPSLMQVASEVDIITGLCTQAGVNGTVLVDDHVTHSSVRERLPENYLFVHFATHGLLDKGALALHDKNLNMQDINACMNAQVVVLSACNTARGELSADGVIGLSRSFLSAGVPALVVSLWSIGDRSTEQFMQLFYKEWLVGAKPLTRAVQSAMCEMIKSGQYAPHQWAPFIVLGMEK